MERVLTAVIYYDEDNTEFPMELYKAFAEGGEYRGTTIAAMSREDVIQRVEQLEEDVIELG